VVRGVSRVGAVGFCEASRDGCSPSRGTVLPGGVGGTFGDSAGGGGAGSRLTVPSVWRGVGGVLSHAWLRNATTPMATTLMLFVIELSASRSPFGRLHFSMP